VLPPDQHQPPPPDGDKPIRNGLIDIPHAGAIATGPTTPGPPPAAPVAQPPQRTTGPGRWLALLFCILVATPPILFELGRPDVTTPTEANILAQANHTWQHQSTLAGSTQFSPERWVVDFNGQSQLHVPPGITWMHVASFVGLTPNNYNPQQLIYRARLVSALMALLTIVAVYWAGLSLGGQLTALFGALVCAATPVFVYQARLANPAMIHTGWAMLVAAMALWAIRPFKPSAPVWRQALGWGGCGLAMGATALTAGPVTLFMMALTVLIILVLCPHRISHLLGWVAAVLICVLMVLPWAAYLQSQNPDLWQSWLAQHLPYYQWNNLKTIPTAAWQRMVVLALILFPWVIWLVGAIVQLISSSSSGHRMRLLLAWVWLGSITTMLLISPNPATVENLLLVIPVAAIVVGQLFDLYVHRSSEGRHTHFWRLFCWPYLAVLAFASAAIGAWPQIQTKLMDHHWLDGQLVGPATWWFWPGLGLGLMMIVGLTAQWIRHKYPGRVLVSWAIWNLVAFTALAIPLSRGPMMLNPLRSQAQAIATMTTGHRLYSYITPIDTLASANLALMVYLDRPIPTITGAQIDPLIDQHQIIYLLSIAPPSPGLYQQQIVYQLPQLGIELWEIQATKANPTPSNQPITNQ